MMCQPATIIQGNTFCCSPRMLPRDDKVSTHARNIQWSVVKMNSNQQLTGNPAEAGQERVKLTRASVACRRLVLACRPVALSVACVVFYLTWIPDAVDCGQSAPPIMAKRLVMAASERAPNIPVHGEA